MDDGNSSLAIPGPLGFGGAPLGDMFERCDPGTAQQTLEAAWDHGIRHFDTSPHYGAGLSEQRMGAFLANKPRDEYVLSTKVGRLLDPAPEGPEEAPPFLGGLWFRRRLDYSADAARRCVEDCLQRLGVGRLDIVYIHDLAEDALGPEWTEHFSTAMAGAARALGQLRDEGVIRGWGLGVNRIEPCMRALQESDPDVFLLATQYHLLDQSGGEELFPACQERGVRVVVGSPFGSGLLAGGAHYHYTEAGSQEIHRRDRIAAVCERHGVDIKAAALQFSAAHPAVAAIIPGARRPERIPQNVELMNTAIPADLWQELKSEGLLPDHAHTPA